MVLEYLLTSSYLCRRQTDDIQDYIESMFYHGANMLHTISKAANYGSPRFITIVQLDFVRGRETKGRGSREFKLCFHFISTCPGLKHLFRNILYKAVRRTKMKMTIKQLRYPGRVCGELTIISDQKLKVFLQRKCSFCCSHNLFGTFSEPFWRYPNNTHLNSSLMFYYTDLVYYQTRLSFHKTTIVIKQETHKMQESSKIFNPCSLYKH